MIKSFLSLFFELYARFISITFSKNCFVFYSKHGFLDNPKYLMKHCLELGRECVWVQIGDKGIGELLLLKKRYPNLKLIYKKQFIKSQFYISRANLVFVSHSFYDAGSFLCKTGKVVNLWHGVALKKMGYDSSSDLTGFLSRLPDNPYLVNDFVIVANDDSKSHMQSCMQLPPDRILNLGQPRNDIFLNIDIKLAEKEGNKASIFLYAPTFRENDEKAKEIYSSLVDSFLERAPENAKLILRLHPNNLHLAKELNMSERVSLSNIDDVQDELLSVDVLISDYSSIVFDFALTKRPIVIYAPDKVEYFKERGGFYFDFRGLFMGVPQYSNADNLNWNQTLEKVEYPKLITLNSLENSSEKILEYFDLN
ncbi:CDP-glycerol glycerophosphotransferase family protein [Pseudoalteromonas piscicida]|uniref:CDP-glycerol--glycerophosphate glycerophosphotransferase n=1 Tax=Pseudoalteromonas piscicida TaxID=43662 RepID=A0A2A5JVX1_PSEO7|nr:CDP-glycerol glycerophosphotransferase family protein [Pseudoalteromonas piscicida]PCK33633.1 hypothetical protein CEX98_01040 [Pseudoalteromonas piscicida]